MESLGDRVKAYFEKTGRSFKENKRSLVFDCINPSCQKEKHLYIQKSDGRTKCMKCGTGWGIVGFLSILDGLSRTEAEKIVLGIDVAAQRDHYDYAIKENLPEVHDRVNSEELSDEDFAVPTEEPLKQVFLDPMFIPVERSETGMEYLKSRGVDDLELIRSFDIRYSATMNGVLFPVYMNGVCVGWQCRYVNPTGKLRMISYEGLQKNRVLLNYDSAKLSKYLILTEGPFDCLKASLPGYGPIASFGKEISESQLNLIRLAKCERLYVGLDRDAVKEVMILAERLGGQIKLLRLLPPDGKKDLGDCTKDEILEALENAPEIYQDHMTRLEVHLE